MLQPSRGVPRGIVLMCSKLHVSAECSFCVIPEDRQKRRTLERLGDTAGEPPWPGCYRQACACCVSGVSMASNSGTWPYRGNWSFLGFRKSSSVAVRRRLYIRAKGKPANSCRPSSCYSESLSAGPRLRGRRIRDKVRSSNR